MDDITFEEAVERSKEFLDWSRGLLGQSTADFEKFSYGMHGDFSAVNNPDARIEIAIDHLRNGDELSADLRAFVADELEKLKSSQTGKKYTTRNSVICHAVCLLALEGFKPTRNKDKGGMASAKGGSACDAVGAALGMGYHNIELIWSADSPEKQLLRAVLAAEKK